MSKNFRTSDYTTAWMKFIELLRRNPELRKVKFRSWDGSPEADDGYSAGQAPWMRVTPEPLPSKILTNKVHSSPVQIVVETVAAENTDVTETMDLWQAIMRSFWLLDSTKQQALFNELRTAGMGPIEMVQPSWGIRDMGKDGGLVLYGKGAFRFNLYPETTQR